MRSYCGLSQPFTRGHQRPTYRSEPLFDAEHQIAAYRRTVDSDEARVIRRIFKLYAEGVSPKSIAHRLNAEHVPPPRSRRDRPNLGWTWTTIAGAPKKTLGILNNPLYIGHIVWNRSMKVRDPETGKRIMRMRPPEEWVAMDAPQLRIVPQDLWDAARKRREAQRRSAKGNTTGRKPRYLLSGLLLCDECGQHYVIKTQPYYGCSTHINRGAEVCSNGRLVKRDRLEEVILRLIFEEVFSPETVAYVSRKVNAALARRAGPLSVALKRRQAALAQARERLEHIKEAIAQGIITPTTKAMLEEAERCVAELEAPLQTPALKHKVSVLPTVVESYLKDLRGTLGRDTGRVRSLLAKLVGHVTLRRDGDHLVAEMRGNLPGLLEIDEQLDNSGAGRGI